MEKLESKTVKGLIWGAGAQIFIYSFQFAVTALLARILAPEDFGSVGIIAVLLEFNVIIGGLGLTTALVQRRDLNRDHLHTAFWSQLGMNLALYVAAVFLSSRIASYYGNPILRNLMLILAFNVILEGLTFIPRSLLYRSMRFKELSLMRGTSEVISGISALALAFGGAGIWSLVGRGMIGRASHVVMLWYKVTLRPRLRFSLKAFRELSPFGMKVMGSDLLEFISSNGDYLIVGKMLGVHALGIYTLAYKLISFPLERIASIIVLTLPAFSAIRDQRERLRSWYLKTTQVTASVVTPLIAGLFILAPELVRTVWGAKWSEAITPIRLLSIAGLALVMEKTPRTVLIAIGKPGLILCFDAAKSLILGFGLIFAARYGILGISAAVAVTVTTVSLAVQIIAAGKLEIEHTSILKTLFPVMISLFAMAGGVITYRSIIVRIWDSDPMLLIGGTLVGAVIYLSALNFSEGRILNEAISLLRNRNGSEDGDES
ncbi:lipopolysaccharide biosynthesis protein [Candidatus Poribacteria bacterium]|nr:lipopolysaccharide biosynthesis protein [Candidatus Poribacteria bacterium]